MDCQKEQSSSEKKLNIHSTDTEDIDAHFTREELNFLASRGVVEVHKKGERLLSEGDLNGSLFIILAGSVRLFASNDKGKEVILHIQSAGGCFDEVALVDKRPSLISAIALEDVAIAKISQKEFRQCIKDRPEMAKSLLHALTERIRYLTGSVKNLALNDVKYRVCKVLFDISDVENSERRIKNPLTHKEIGLMIGASREMVSKTMKKLQDDGEIEVSEELIKLNSNFLNYIDAQKRD